MTKPGDPSQGKPDEAAVEQTAADSAKAASEAAAEQAAEAKAPEPAAADATSDDATADEPAAAGEAAEEDVAVDDEDAPAPATKADDEPAAEAAATPAAEKKPRRRSRKAAEPAQEEAPKPAPTRRRDRRTPGEEQVIVRAQARYVRSSARKARLVSDNVRGKSVTEARAILAFSPRAAAEAWTKLLESAVANAENNHDLVGEELKIHAIYADEGPTIKRFRPRAMGRATRIRKRTSHLTIQLTPKD